MAHSRWLDLDPRSLHLPTSRLSGADPVKLHDQIKGSNGGDYALTNSPLKQEILRALSELVEQCPDVRFGQLIVDLSCIARGPTPEAVWDMEDDELLEATRSHLEDYERRSVGVA